MGVLYIYRCKHAGAPCQLVIYVMWHFTVHHKVNRDMWHHHMQHTLSHHMQHILSHHM